MKKLIIMLFLGGIVSFAFSQTEAKDNVLEKYQLYEVHKKTSAPAIFLNTVFGFGLGSYYQDDIGFGLFSTLLDSIGLGFISYGFVAPIFQKGLSKALSSKITFDDYKASLSKSLYGVHTIIGVSILIFSRIIQIARPFYFEKAFNEKLQKNLGIMPIVAIDLLKINNPAVNIGFKATF